MPDLRALAHATATGQSTSEQRLSEREAELASLDELLDPPVLEFLTGLDLWSEVALVR